MAGTRNTTLEVTTPSDREVRFARAFDAPRDVLWEMWTNPKHVAQWLLGPEGWTMPVCEIDLRPGGKWHWVWRKADGTTEFGMDGEYREVKRPERLVNTERWGDEWPESVNTLEFVERNGRTTVICTVLYASKEVRDKAVATGMTGGVEASYNRLDSYLTKQP
jgi:uncharacterized protein YndB with AHSA1/START domain